MVNKIDSNVTGLAFAEEATLKTLPVTPLWNTLEPNSYSDFGGEISTVARAPINASRQRQKGTVTDLDASGGFNSDLTQNNFAKLLQGFFFADMREKPNTQPINGASIAITAVATSDDSFAAASGLNVFTAGSIVLASGFGIQANNGIAVVATTAAGKITVSKNLVDEATPPATSKIQTVGFEFASGDVSLTASASSIVLTSVAKDFNTLGLTVGEWVFIGGDATTNTFANNAAGYARIGSIAAHTITFTDTTFVATTDAGTGKLIRMYFGNVLRNEKEANKIKRRSYQIERTLGSDANGVQSEYLVGAIANEFNLTIPQTNKITADLSFVAMDNEQRNGTQGLKTGTRIGNLNEDAFNTSSDIYRMRVNVVDPNTLNNTALFGYVSEVNLSINNNITANKAIGVVGSFDATAGDFEVGGSLTAYFTTVDAVKAVRQNADVALNIIAAQKNGALIFDIPLLSLSGGRVNVEKDQAITVPLDTAAAENPNGYTLLTTFLPYIPDVGMPV